MTIQDPYFDLRGNQIITVVYERDEQENALALSTHFLPYLITKSRSGINLGKRRTYQFVVVPAVEGSESKNYETISAALGAISPRGKSCCF